MKILCGIVIIINMIIVVLGKELALYVQTHSVSENLGLSELFYSMKTTCIWELLF